LPLPLVFPINALFFLFFFLVAFGKVGGYTTAASQELPVAGARTKATAE
jgi:hypothetical protein